MSPDDKLFNYLYSYKLFFPVSFWLLYRLTWAACCSTFTLTGERTGGKNGEYVQLVGQDLADRPAYQGGEDDRYTNFPKFPLISYFHVLFSYFIFYDNTFARWQISTSYGGSRQASMDSTAECLANGDELVHFFDSSDILTISDCSLVTETYVGNEENCQ